MIEKRLRLIKSIPVNDCLMGAFNYYPVLFWNCPALLNFIAYCRVFTLNHVPHIHFVTKYTTNRTIWPKPIELFPSWMFVIETFQLFICGRIRNAHFIKIFCDANDTAAINKFFKNHTHDWCGLRIYD